MKIRPITRASSQGVRTIPVEKQRHAKQIRGNITLHPDELALALDMARTERIERDVAAYEIRKRTA